MNKWGIGNKQTNKKNNGTEHSPEILIHIWSTDILQKFQGNSVATE